jgi:hypothetical protein
VDCATGILSESKVPLAGPAWTEALPFRSRIIAGEGKISHHITAQRTYLPPTEARANSGRHP